MTLAIELGRRGVDATLIDAKANPTLTPRANATQARTMEHFRRLGFANQVRSLGLPTDYPTDIAYFTRYGGIELARLRLPSARKAVTLARELTGSWSAAELPHRVAQKYVEEVLKGQVAALRTVQLNYGWGLENFIEESDGVVAYIRNMDGGESRIQKADYLIGVDGAHSTVRRSLGIRYGGETGVVRDFFGGKMISVYLKAPDFYKAMPHDQAWMYWSFNTTRRSWLAAINGRDEFVMHTQLKPGEDEVDLSSRRARELFSQVCAVPIRIEVLAVDTWTAGHALVAESFGRGRVYIGGDAAHLFTPAGGLGYNTAVEDSVNLAWKLAATIGGRAGPHLLPSYGYERRKLALRNTDYARRLADSIGQFLPQSDLESDTPEGAAARRAAGEYLSHHAAREFNIPGITFGGRYDGSPVIISDGASLPTDHANAYVPTASPGGRPPHAWLGDDLSLFDLFGSEWTLMQLCDKSSAVEDMRKAAEKFDTQLQVVKLASPEVRLLYESDLVLIRPDQIVAWRGSGAMEDCERTFAQLLGYPH